MKRRLDLVLELEGLNARMIRDQYGKTNLDHLLAQIQKEKGPEPEKPPGDWRDISLPIPFEVKGRFQLRGMSFELEDRGQGKSLHLEKTSLSLDLPYISSGQPITLKVSTEPMLDGRKLTPIHLEARVEKLLRSGEALDLGGALIDVRGELPGCQIAFTSDLKKAGMKGRVDVDLASLMEVLRPFMPADVSSTEIMGHVALVMEVSGDSKKPMTFDITFGGENLRVSGGPVGHKQMGPVHWKAVQQGVFDVDENRLTVQKGEIHILDRSQLSWRASLDRATDPSPQVEFALGPATIDLTELHSLVAPLLPEGIMVQLDGGVHSTPATIKVKDFRFAGALRSGTPSVKTSGTVRLKDLIVSLPALRMKSGETALSARDLSLSVGHLQSKPEENLPIQVNAEAAFTLAKLELEGAQKVLLEGFKIPSIETSISLDNEFPTQASIRTALQLDKLRLKGEQEVMAERLSLPSVEVSTDFEDRSPTQTNIKTALHLDRLEFKGKQEATMDGLEVPSMDISTHFKGRFPSQADIKTTLSVDKLEFKGERQAVAEGLQISTMDVLARFVEKSPSLANIKTALHLDRLRFKGGREGTVEGLEVPSMEVSTRFEERFPNQAAIKTALRLGKLELKGKQDLLVEGLEVASLDATAREMHRSESALFGVASHVSLKESISIKEFIVRKLAKVSNLRHSLDAECVLKPTASCVLTVGSLTASSPSIRLEKAPGGAIETNATLDASIAGIRLAGLAPLKVGVQGFRSRLDVEDFLEARFEVKADQRAPDHLMGEAHLDLRPAKFKSRGLLPEGFRDLQLSDGTIKVGCHIAGRLPKEDEIKRLTRSKVESPEVLDALGFLDRLELLVNLDNLDVISPSAEKQPLREGQISTEAPLKIVLDRGGRKAMTRGSLLLKGIQPGPSLGISERPYNMNLTFSGSAEDLKAFKFSETLKVDGLNLEQTGHFTLSGTDRLLNQVLNHPWRTSIAPLLAGLGGTFRGELKIGQGGDLSSMIEDLSLDGPLSVGAEIRLIPGQAFLAKGWFETPGADIRVGRGIRIRQLQSHLNLEKRYLIKKGTKRKAEEEGTPASLSKDVLESLSGEVAASEVEKRIARRFVEDLRGRGNGRPSLSFESARLEMTTMPVELAHHAMDFHLVKGLPTVDYFQVDLLGGTVIGAISVSRRDKGFGLNARASFSGINAKKMLPHAAHGVPDEQAEINGQVSLAMPLSTRFDSVVSGLRLDVKLTHIGSKALERILYGLDPYENNEAIVNQRKQLRTGTPRWMHMRIQNGSLSIFGEVEVKGIRLEIPPIERLNLANLPGLQGLEEALLGLDPLMEALHMLAARIVSIDDRGKLRFLSSRLP